MSTLLVIDDDRLHCDLLQMALARHGYQVSTATGGREGVALFRQLRPLVTLLDLRMPDMDGLAVLKEIRTLDPRAGVIMLGGGATEELENQARKLRVTDFFRKGLSLDVLIGAVHRVAQQVRRDASAAESRASEEPDDASAEQILVVDDDANIRSLLQQEFTEAGYKVRLAEDGRRALQMVREEAPGLIVLDVMMPDMDGWETCYRIRQISTVPIIFLTGRQTIDDKVSGLKLGADDYLIKPFLPDELLARVETVLRRTYRTRQPLSSMLRAGPDILINQASHEVFQRGDLRALQPAEFTLLVLLAEHAGDALSVNTIADTLGIPEGERRRERVKWHIWKLRQSIEDDPKHPKLIVTEPGVGYRLEPH